MITYKETMPGMHLPVLHRVYYNPGSPIRFDVWAWCKEHCKERFYQSPGWTKEFFAEFEDDEDATLFALKWS